MRTQGPSPLSLASDLMSAGTHFPSKASPILFFKKDNASPPGQPIYFNFLNSKTPMRTLTFKSQDRKKPVYLPINTILSTVPPSRLKEELQVTTAIQQNSLIWWDFTASECKWGKVRTCQKDAPVPCTFWSVSYFLNWPCDQYPLPRVQIQVG